jgi:hypothetical protein
MLRYDSYIGQHGHEVRVPLPAWDDVLVQVPDDAGAGRAAEIPAEIESFRAILRRQNLNRSNREGVDLVNFLRVKRAQISNMAARRHLQMPGGVGNADSPRWTTSDSLPGERAAWQRKHSVSSPALSTYASRHGAQRDLVIWLL